MLENVAMEIISIEDVCDHFYCYPIWNAARSVSAFTRFVAMAETHCYKSAARRRPGPGSRTCGRLTHIRGTRELTTSCKLRDSDGDLTSPGVIV